MDPFLETFWNLDQSWAETRDPELSATPLYLDTARRKKRRPSQFLLRTFPPPLLRGQRDIDAELWAASGWKPKIANFIPSKDFQEYAEQRGMPVWQAYRYRDIAEFFLSTLLSGHWAPNGNSRQRETAV